MAPSFLPLCLPSGVMLVTTSQHFIAGPLCCTQAIITTGRLLFNDYSAFIWTVGQWMNACNFPFVMLLSSWKNRFYKSVCVYVKFFVIIMSSIIVFQIITGLQKDDECLDFIPHSVKTFTLEQSTRRSGIEMSRRHSSASNVSDLCEPESRIKLIHCEYYFSPQLRRRCVLTSWELTSAQPASKCASSTPPTGRSSTRTSR